MLTSESQNKTEIDKDYAIKRVNYVIHEMEKETCPQEYIHNIYITLVALGINQMNQESPSELWTTVSD